MKPKTPLSAKTTLKAKKPIATKPKKHTINWYKKKADTVYSKATRLRFAQREGNEWMADCITCGARKPIKSLQCGHFMSRQYNALRYEPENTAPQCYGCNVMQQGKQFEFGIAIDNLYGEGTAKKLHKQSKVAHQFTQAELEEVIENSTEEIAFYERQENG